MLPGGVQKGGQLRRQLQLSRKEFQSPEEQWVGKADSPSCSCPSPEEVEEEETPQQGLVQNRAWTAAPQVHWGTHSSCQNSQGQFCRSLWLWQGPSFSPVTKGCHTFRAGSGPWLVHLWNG